VRAALCLVLVASLARAQFREWNDFPENPKSATSVSPSGLDGGAQNTSALAPLIEIPALQERYAEAAQHLSAREYSRALGLLQQLVSDFPQVPQIYSARCSANLGLAQWNLALIDCQYALQLRPQLPTAVYGLAQAQEKVGLLLEAAQNYRLYSELRGADDTYTSKVLARKRSKELVAHLQAQQELAGPAFGTPGRPSPQSPRECRAGPDGQSVCGYNCRASSSGRISCSSVPNGLCTLNSDGTLACP
jgi:tetratricopeptide (TPR) repeat protein